MRRILIVATGLAIAAGPALADEYYIVRPGGFPQLQQDNSNPMDSFYRAQQASQRAEMNRLEIERQRMEIENRRSGTQQFYCRLPDGRFVQCQ